MKCLVAWRYLIVLLVIPMIDGKVSQWTKLIDQSYKNAYSVYGNSMYEGSFVDVRILCSAASQAGTKLKIHWILQELECMDELYSTQQQIQTKDSILSQLSYDMLQKTDHLKPAGHIIIPRTTVPRKGSDPKEEGAPSRSANGVLSDSDGERPHPNVTSAPPDTTVIKFQVSSAEIYDCEHSNIFTLKDESSLPYYKGYFNPQLAKDDPKRFTWTVEPSEWKSVSQDSPHTARIWEDGMYHFMLNILPVDDTLQFNATVSIKMKQESSYLPAIQWPLLPVRGILAFLYLGVGTVWVLLWARSHQHTLKIHIIIGAVAVAAALANTLSFVELSSTSSTGNGVMGLKWLSVFLSVIQNCLIQLVLMVVSTGYGITRPELQRNLLAAAMCLTSFTAVTNFLSTVVLDEDLKIKYNMPLLALGVNASYGIFMLILGGWIMIFSIMTFIHLGRRKHSAKKVCSFTIFTVSCVLIFVVNLALMFMGLGFNTKCSKDWRLEWLFKSFGSMTTLVLLVVLMWLWRPVDQTQSYAFTPLNTEDNGLIAEDSDEDVELTIYDKLPSGPNRS